MRVGCMIMLSRICGVCRRGFIGRAEVGAEKFAAVPQRHTPAAKAVLQSKLLRHG